MDKSPLVVQQQKIHIMVIKLKNRLTLDGMKKVQCNMVGQKGRSANVPQRKMPRTVFGLLQKIIPENGVGREEVVTLSKKKRCQIVV